MLPTNDTDYKTIFTELIRKQMLVLGPDITLAKVKNVQGITVDNGGVVQSITGDPQQLLQQLINQFVELSGMIVKKTMESILTSYPGVLLGNASQSAVTLGAPMYSPSQPQVMPQETVPLNSVLSPTPIKVDQPPIINANPQPQVTEENKTEEKIEPPQFSQNQLDELNHALDELSKSPLSTENSAQK